ncbi:MAG: Spx/MgsR family RNA polymerase-binding regulatory protein [Aquimonas sp.]|nr:Spx/MgsR family RNA polymerase-binding regulatory protein [Aquimonas sp.]
MPTLYGLDKCSTCDKARAWLDARGIAHTFIDYRDNPIDPKLLKAWAKTLTWEKLVNRASYTWRDLPDARKQASSDADWLALVKEFPALVKRPVVVTEDAVSVGFSEKQFGLRFGA